MVTLSGLRYRPAIGNGGLKRNARIAELLLAAARTLGDTLDREQIYDRFHELLETSSSTTAWSSRRTTRPTG
jgi:hypothetical protein